MVPRPLGRTGLMVTALGFGAFKIGRDQGTRYEAPYVIPDERAATRLLLGVLDAGVRYIDTAPSYGLSEERIGRALGRRRRDVVVSTKVGEAFEGGRSTYDFSAPAVRASVERSLRRLRRDALDLVFVHAPAADVAALSGAEVVPALEALRREGLVRSIGLSSKTVAAAKGALSWADVLMVEYHIDDRSHAAIIRAAAAAGVAVVVKKGLASGRLDARAAIELVLETEGVTSLVVGGLDLAHVRANVRAVEALERRLRR